MGLWEALRDEIVGVGVVLSVGEGVEGERGSGASGKGWGGTSYKMEQRVGMVAMATSHVNSVVFVKR